MKPERQFMTRPRSTSVRETQTPAAKASDPKAGDAAGAHDQPSPTRNEAPKHGADLPQLVPSPLPFRRTIRRAELRQIVPLADTTIYEMERRGEFPQRFCITSRCVVWDLEEVEAWIDARRKASNAALLKRAPVPDVRQRKRRPVRGESAS